MKNKYIEDILNNKKYIYYAHRKEDNNEKELLSSHLELTYMYYKEMDKSKKIEEKVKKIITDTFMCNDEFANIMYERFAYAIRYHDIGKINPLFQKNKMDNDLNLVLKELDDTHSALSARIFIDSFIFEDKEIIDKLNKKNKMAYLYMIYCFAYIISRHHSSIEGIVNLEEAIKSKNIPQIDDGKDEIYQVQLEKLLDKIEDVVFDGIGIYILCKLLYSCIVTADFYATYQYMTGKNIKIENKSKELFKNYMKSDLVNNINRYKNKEIVLDDINRIRTDIFIETEENLINNIENDIFYIKAPTGSGKTNLAINLARILYNNNDIKSIQYIFPYNNIIEQTAATFENYFENYKDFIVINSTSSIVKDINENLDYEREYIKNSFRQYPIVITSHINLFDTLFGNGKEANFGIFNLMDSVIVIDEIQAYSNNLWREIINMISKYSKFLNIKFIIMSATLPKIDELLGTEKITKFCSLISDSEKYYQNKLFKDRVELNFDLLDIKISIEDLVDKILKEKNKKILVECIKKSTAEELFEKLSEKKDNVYILTSDDNKYRKKEIIEITKQKEELILIATQTIEAGVDIDMDVGFKDISFLDSEEQFLGRINRSSKKNNCIAYFFDLDDAKKIYLNDNRLEFNLKNDEVKKWLVNKNFDYFYLKVMEKIYDKTEKYNDNNIKNFYSACKFINYKKIKNKMKLINSNTIQLFLNYNLVIKGKTIKGKEVFDEYKSICQDHLINYSEKKIRLSMLNETMNCFISTVFENEMKQICGEKWGDLYYIEDGFKYMENGRFNRKKYLDQSEDIFL